MKARLSCVLAAAALALAPAGAAAVVKTIPTVPVVSTATSPTGGAAAPAATSTQAATTPAATTLTPAASGTPTTPASVHTVTVTRTSGKSSGVSGWAILAAALGALLVLACVVWAIFRYGAFEPHWLASLRHSLAEAGYRISETWAELLDWARLGH
jgi:hypothetical protein